MSSGSSDQGGLLPVTKDVTRNTGRHLLVRQLPTLTTKLKVPVDAVVISQLKQKLPIFRAIELTSLNKRFALTTFDKRTVELQLYHPPGGDESLVRVALYDEKKTDSQQQYKGRAQTVPIDALGDFLKNVTAKGIVIRTLVLCCREALLKAALAVENHLPAASRLLLRDRLEVLQQEFHWPSLLPLIDRLAGRVQQMTLATANGYQFVQCLQKFTNLHRLHVYVTHSPRSAPNDWLANAVEANSGQLKQLKIGGYLFFCSPAVFADRCLAAVAQVKDVQFHGGFHTDTLIGHVETDLAGQGQCMLTQLVLARPPTAAGRLTIDIYDWAHDVHPLVIFIGDRLRLGYYLLSLHKTGQKVVVRMQLLMDEQSLDDFFTDLCRFYSPPLMKTKTGVERDGEKKCYRLRIGRVTMYLFQQ